MRRFKEALLVLSVLTAANAAHAGLIPGAVQVASDGGVFRYTYNLHLPSDYMIKSGDFFTVYDFAGFNGGTVQPTGWNFSSQLLGPNPDRILPQDSDIIPNLTWVYNGPDISGPQLLDPFVASSNVGPKTMDLGFASSDHRQADGRAVSNYTSAFGPDPSTIPDPEPGPGTGNQDIPDAPEPATFVLLGLALPFAGLARRWRNRRA